MATKSFYPNIGTLVTLNDFPEELQFLEDGLQNALDKIYYKELQYVRSNDGAQGYYKVVLVTGEQLKLDLFGTGFSIVINPGGAGETIIPLTLNYNWPILALISSFNLESFSYFPADLQNILNQTLSLGDTDLIQTAVQVFEGDDSLSSYESFVDKINQHYSLSGSNEIPYPEDSDSLDMAEEIRWSIEENSVITDSAQEVINQIYILSSNSATYTSNLNQFILNFTGESIQDYIKRIIIPKIEATLALSLGLAFPRNILVPVDSNGNPLPDPEQSILVFDIGTLEFNTQGGISFQKEMDVSLNYPSQIGNTGLEIDIKKAKLDLSKNSNIIEADLDGRPQDFIGGYAQYVGITLPPRWFNNVDNTTLRIAGYNMLIGTGGVSGTITLEATNGTPSTGDDYLTTNIGNWEVGFNHFDITFKQNAITQSNIEAKLIIPKFKKTEGSSEDNLEAELQGHLYEDGDFALTASFSEGLKANLFNFVTFNFLTFELGRVDDNFFLGTSCQIWFENEIMKKLLDNQIIEIPKLRIYDNGTIEIVGGTGLLPVSISLNLGPIDMAVTGIHYGSTQLKHGNDMRKYSYWGFDGAISIDPLGIDVRGDGIKYYYTTDNDEYGDNGDSFIQIKTLEIDLIIPGTASPEAAIAIIHGMLSIPDPGESPQYVGEVSLKLPKLKMAGGVSMKMQPRYPAFMLDAFLDLPAPIPVGPLGIYGFRGLLGYRYAATREAVGLTSDDRWYDYYVYPPRGIHSEKFIGPPESLEYTAPVALGAGAVLGTSFDNGTVISARVMLVLSLPALFMIDGRASILSARLGLEDTKEPPFFAFVAWGDNSVEMGMGADFKIPSGNGWIFKLYAEVQAGFFFNSPSAWYVNLGTKQNPISARVLTLVTAQSYLMLSAQGIEAGARVDFELNKRFGPAKVHLFAYLEIGGHISFERPQMGGYVAAGGGIDIDIWIIGISLSLNAILSAEAAKPFLIYAEVRFRACAKLGFIRVCKSFTVKLKWEKSKTVDYSPVSPLPSSGTVNRVNELVKGIHMLTNDSFDLKFFTAPPAAGQIDKVIPLDTYIEIKTEKGLVPGAVSGKIGGYTFAPQNCVDLIPPEKVVRGGHQLRQVKHRYSIENIEIKAWNGSSWQNYHPFEAVVDPDSRPDVAGLRIGCWQIKEMQYDTIRILATTPFTYMEAGEPGWHVPEMYGITPSTLYCQEQLRTEKCVNVLNKALGTIYYPPTQYEGEYINGAYFTLLYAPLSEYENGEGTHDLSEYMEVTNAENLHGFIKSLSFNNSNAMVIILPEPSVEVKLRFTTYARGAVVSYYKSVIDDSTSIVQYELIHQVYKTAPEINNNVIEYTNEDILTAKVIINPDSADLAAMQQISEQIAELFEATYDNASGEVSVTEPSDLKSYRELVSTLEELRGRGCSKGKDNSNNRSDLRCTTSLQQICWLSLEDHQWNQTVPGSESILEDFEDMTEAVQKAAQPVWRPNTSYYISIQLKDEVDNGNKQSGIFNYYYGFKTVGPLGHYHKNPASGYMPPGANPDEYTLTSLRSYIDYKRSYPNADGNLLKAKPLFYGNKQCKISVFFNKPSTCHMFQTWDEYLNLPELDGQLHIAIKDPVTDVIIPYPLPEDYDETVPFPDENGYMWDGDNDPQLPVHIQVLNNMIENGELPCEIDLGEPIVPASSYFNVTLMNLNPQKLYTALLYNAFEVTNDNVVSEPVHEFVFQTSRYESFEKQINSYLIQDEETETERQAVYTVGLNLDNSAVVKALDIVSDPDSQINDPLGNNYQHLFDRVIEGVFEMPPADPPTGTEFHKIINLLTDKVVAILIKNPEPFNIPKISLEELEELEEMIAVMDNGIVNRDYKVLYSKDYSQAIIMHNSAKITAGTMDFIFRYYMWDGSKYVIAEDVLAEKIKIND